MLGRAAAVAGCVLVFGCGARSSLDVYERGAPCDEINARRRCSTACGDGFETCDGTRWVGCTAPRPREPPALLPLPVTLRDFSSNHPDFEHFIFEDDRGIVERELGLDDKPVYAGMPSTVTTTGRAAFDTWYRDVEGTNLSKTTQLSLQLEEGTSYAFHSDAFFPIDGELLGSEGREHNFHFTLELHTQFLYRGGEAFSFSGDDDLWVFMNDHLVIDLGGVHSQQSQSVSIDAIADAVQMQRGDLVPMSLFFAERHTTGSTFHIETTIVDFEPCEP